MGKIEGRRRREEPRMRCLDGITNSMDMSLSTVQEIMKNREDWRVSVMGSQSRTRVSGWITILWKETFNFPIYFLSVQFILVSQSCPSLCDPMDCSTSCLPVHHQLPEFTETHIHWAEKEMATHSSTLAWKIPWTEEPGRLQSMGSRRVGHDQETSLSLFTFSHWRRKWQPTPVFLPGESQGWQSLMGCRLWGCTESNTTEVT